MRYLRAILLSIFVSFFLPTMDSYGIGEIFKIETSGIEYCGDFSFARFNAANNIDLWVSIDSETQLTVSFTPTFDVGTTFVMTGTAFQTAATRAAFVAGVLFVDGSYATVQGQATANRFGEVVGISGTFIQSGVVNPGCFSSGKFRSTQRLL